MNHLETILSHTAVFDRHWMGTLSHPDLLNACTWAGREALQGYTTLSMQEDEKVIIFTASKPD